MSPTPHRMSADTSSPVRFDTNHYVLAMAQPYLHPEFPVIGGVLYAHNLATLTALPKNFGYNMSIMFLVFVVLGGIGNMRGSIIAAVILNLLPELLRGLSDYRMLFYAIVLIVMMLINWAPKAIEMRERLFSKFKKKEA